MKTYLSPTFCNLRAWKIGLLAAAVVLLGHALAYGDDYTDGLKRAKTTNKAVVLYFYSQYCGYCAAMDRDVLADKEIAATLKNDFVFLRIDADKRTDIARHQNIRGYPTTVLLEPSGKAIMRVPGYLDKREFKLLLSYSKKKPTNRQP
jgi:thioredoxin-related protein